MTPLRHLVVTLAISTALIKTADAATPTTEACFAAAVKGQELRNAGRLLGARAELIACAQPACPAEVTQDCTRWLREVNAALPTVVFGARDAHGDLADVSVFIDGALAGSTSDGRPVALDPGPHALRFVREGRAPIEQSIVARAGEKNRAIVAGFDAPLLRTAEPRATSTEPSGARPVPLASWVLGASGAVALGVFGYFGARGVSDYGRFGCASGCAAADKRNVDAEFRAADVTLLAGIVLLGAATIVYLTRPPAAAAPRAASVRF